MPSIKEAISLAGVLAVRFWHARQGPFCEGAHSAGNSDSIYFRSDSRFNFRSLEAKVTTLWKELTTLWKNDQSTIGGNRPVASRLNGQQGEVGPMRVTT